MNEGQLTVQKLVALLLTYPQDALVRHEGCDCCGMADGVEYDKDANSVLITRLKSKRASRTYNTTID